MSGPWESLHRCPHRDPLERTTPLKDGQEICRTTIPEGVEPPTVMYQRYGFCPCCRCSCFAMSSRPRTGTEKCPTCDVILTHVRLVTQPVIITGQAES